MGDKCVQGTVELVHTSREGVCDLLDARAVWTAAAGLVARSGAAAGFLHLCVADARGVALSLNENCDATVRSDLTHALEHIVPSNGDDSDSEAAVADARAALVGPAVALPFERRGGVLTGTWQGVYLCDFRARAQRTAAVAAVATVVPAPAAPARVHFDPPGRGCHVLPIPALAPSTEPSTAAASESGAVALAAVLVRHTSAAVALGAGGAGDARARDAVEKALSALVPERWNCEFFRHTYEGPDDMPAHVKSTVVGASLVLPAPLARAAGGPLLCEHRNCGGWGGGGRTCVVAASAPTAVQRTVALEGSGDGRGARVVAVSDAVRGALAAAGGARVLVSVVCAGGDGAVALAVVPRGAAAGAVLARLRAALVLRAAGDMAAAAAATVLGRAVTLPVAALAATHDVCAVHMADGPVPACKLIVTAL